jgi:hypothetical protein
MKTPKANRDEVRANSLCVLLSAEEKAAVGKEAYKAGLSLSAWARMVLNEKLKQK